MADFVYMGSDWPALLLDTNPEAVPVMQSGGFYDALFLGIPAIRSSESMVDGFVCLAGVDQLARLVPTQILCTNGPDLLGVKSNDNLCINLGMNSAIVGPMNGGLTL